MDGEASKEMTRRHAEEIELAWERNRQLEAQALESEATHEARMRAAAEEAEAQRIEMEAEFVTRMETRVAAAVTVVQVKLEKSEAARAADKMAHAAEIAKGMKIRLEQQEKFETQVRVANSNPSRSPP